MAERRLNHSAGCQDLSDCLRRAPMVHTQYSLQFKEATPNSQPPEHRVALSGGTLYHSQTCKGSIQPNLGLASY